ncbi:HAL/PAL/TAL family ammonia-lyase [Lactococcus allomyrinae]|uniref:Histidine ammonia-lyase n=1 Tax=Lactococcus allomyrinae TaxID=2419773 RepID=A0A387BE49_9LACT|nr:aromatic amino acid ammonia-lyase [Lactococcus allomyrinae]AYG00342.1 histidine ammonia-lyase [Lactococcus allomyrinae]
MAHKIILTGFDLQIVDVLRIAREDYVIELDSKSMQNVRKARQIVLKKANGTERIYGLNTGVGQNKDQLIALDSFENFNRNLIYSHLVAIGELVPEVQARAVVLIKLHSFLRGNAGVGEEIIFLLKELLNRHITPVMKATSSIGEADLGTLAFLGLVLMGEGEVYYQGRILKTAEVFEKEDLKAVVLGVKDGLSIVSSNAYSQALSIFAIDEMRRLLSNMELIYSLTLEAVDGNITPFLYYRKTAPEGSGYRLAAEKILTNLTDSYLLENHQRKSMQDPLSFRNFPSVVASLYDALAYLSTIVSTNLTVSDENPYVDLEREEILSTSNYDTTSVALALEMVNTALSQLARMSVFRIIKLGDSSFTDLPRFLAANEQMLGFQTLQKTAVRLEVQINDLTNTTINNFYPISSGIEDYATNLLLILSKNAQILSYFNYILAIEGLSAAQAIDLRHVKRLGAASQQLYSKFRTLVPFLDRDYNLSELVEKIASELIGNTLGIAASFGAAQL